MSSARASAVFAAARFLIFPNQAQLDIRTNTLTAFLSRAYRSKFPSMLRWPAVGHRSPDSGAQTSPRATSLCANHRCEIMDFGKSLSLTKLTSISRS